MNMADRRLQGVEFSSCNCERGCPGQFSALPNKGYCEAVAGMQIEHGHFNQTSLDGLRRGAVFAWPGPIHEDNRSCQVYVEDTASPAQRWLSYPGGLMLVLWGLWLGWLVA